MKAMTFDYKKSFTEAVASVEKETGQSWLNSDGQPNEKFQEQVANTLMELAAKSAIEVCFSQRDPGNLNYKPSQKFAESLQNFFGFR